MGPGASEIRQADETAIAQAAAVIRRGGLVAFPTETVYGLGADATSDRAVARIFAAKARPRFNPLIVHVPDVAAARALARFAPRAEALAARFWPGPLTLVLPRAADCPASLLVSAGLPTIALRAPDHAVAQALLRASGVPIAAPSANRSGGLSPTEAAHVADSLGAEVDLVLDGGPCRVGVESSIVGLAGETPLLLRPGGLAREAIEAVAGPLALPAPGDAPSAPGMLESHYAPRLPLRMNAAAARAGEALLGFGAAPEADLNLSEAGDTTEAAANLFAMLHALDRPPYTGIAVMPVPETGLGLAINDRLRRAAGAERRG